MQLKKQQLELCEIDGNKAYFGVNVDDRELALQVEFELEYTLIADEERGIGRFYDCTFFNIVWISYVYDERTNEKVGDADIRESDIQELIENYLETNDMTYKYEI
jgi:hypothetical protein